MTDKELEAELDRLGIRKPKGHAPVAWPKSSTPKSNPVAKPGEF